MPDCDVTLTANWIDPNLQYLNTENDAFSDGVLVSASDKLKALTADTPVDLVIPAEINGTQVIGIAANGFNNCLALVSVTILEGPKRINDNAFTGCTSFRTINIPNSVYMFDSSAFGGVEGITINIKAPEGSFFGVPWGATNATVNWLG